MSRYTLNQVFKHAACTALSCSLILFWYKVSGLLSFFPNTTANSCRILITFLWGSLMCLQHSVLYSNFVCTYGYHLKRQEWMEVNVGYSKNKYKVLYVPAFSYTEKFTNEGWRRNGTSYVAPQEVKMDFILGLQPISSLTELS